MMTLNTSVIRESTLVSDDVVRSWCMAQAMDLADTFGKHWDVGGSIEFVAGGQNIPSGGGQIIILDHSDQADALGYHDDTGPNGEPRAKIFIQDIRTDGAEPSVTFSHEYKEYMVNPMIAKLKRYSSGDVIYEVPEEVCDACEDDRFAYIVNGVLLSAHVLPDWFDATKTDGPFTYPNIPAINRPFRLATGGYIGIHQVYPTLTAWTTVQMDQLVRSKHLRFDRLCNEQQ